MSIIDGAGGFGPRKIEPPFQVPEDVWENRKLDIALAKRALLGESRDRLEFGSVKTHLGAVTVAHERRVDMFTIDSTRVQLIEIDRDLRNVFISASDAFSKATSDEEQAGQKAIIASVVDAVLKRHAFIAAKVREGIEARR